jgi:hypothetical protein
MRPTPAVVPPVVALALLGGVGCAAEVYQRTLDMPVGADRERVASELRDLAYCREREPPQRQQRYARCAHPGLELGQSWVLVEFDRDGVWQAARRLERYATGNEALRRWNELTALRRVQSGDDSQDARRYVVGAGRLPEGATAWLSWYVQGGRAVASVYLMRDAPPGRPNVIEELIEVSR